MPSWFRGHHWVRDSKSNGFHPHDFRYDDVRSRGGFDFCTSDEDEPELSFVMLFMGTSTHIIGILSLIIFNGRILDVLIRKALETGVLKPTMRTKYPPRQRYRTCALRWHPDRHHGSSKATAEEKFKHCGEQM